LATQVGARRPRLDAPVGARCGPEDQRAAPRASQRCKKSLWPSSIRSLRTPTPTPGRRRAPRSS